MNDLSFTSVSYVTVLGGVNGILRSIEEDFYDLSRARDEKP